MRRLVFPVRTTLPSVPAAVSAKLLVLAESEPNRIWSHMAVSGRGSADPDYLGNLRKATSGVHHLERADISMVVLLAGATSDSKHGLLLEFRSCTRHCGRLRPP